MVLGHNSAISSKFYFVMSSKLGLLACPEMKGMHDDEEDRDNKDKKCH